jgi:adenosylcobinamide-phosphate synthase
MVGYKTEEYADFGYASAKLDDLLNFIPARLSVFFIALASRSVTENISDAADCARENGRALPSPNSGYPIAAFAGALGVRLCGPVSYFGKLKDKPFIGDGPRPGRADLYRAISLYWNAYGLSAAASTLAAWLIGNALK